MSFLGDFCPKTNDKGELRRCGKKGGEEAMFGKRRCHKERRNPGYIIAAVGLGMLLAYIIPVFAMFVMVGIALVAGGIFLVCRK